MTTATMAWIIRIPLIPLHQLQRIGADPTSYYRQREYRLHLEEEYGDDGFSDHDDDKEDDMMAIIGHGGNGSLFGIHRSYGNFWRR